MTPTRIITCQPQTTTRAGVVAQLGYQDGLFTNVYMRRNVGVAPNLDERFDARAQEIYAGLNTKRTFLPSETREHYVDVSMAELDAVAMALQTHSAASFAAIRSAFSLPNLTWMLLENGANVEVIERPSAKATHFTDGVDAVVVGPKVDNQPVTLGMYVADCLAILIVDQRTKAFAFVHAGRPCTGQRLAEKAAAVLRDQFGSDPADLSAYLGEGVCQHCYRIDEETYRGFVDDFGGEAEVAKVLRRRPGAVKRFEVDEARNIGIDLYAFNAYLLAGQGVGEIIMAPNCTARLNTQCISLTGAVPVEHEQLFYSHTRTKNRLIGWRMANGETLELNTSHLTTPRNFTTITRW